MGAVARRRLTWKPARTIYDLRVTLPDADESVSSSRRGVTPKSPVIRTYRNRARHYDVTAKLYYVLGYPQRTHRRRAVQALQLHRGIPWSRSGVEQA